MQGHRLLEVPGSASRHLFLTVRSDGARFADIPEIRGAAVLTRRLFGEAHDPLSGRLTRILGNGRVPGLPPCLQVEAVAGPAVEPVASGVRYQEAGVTVCALQNLLPQNPAASPADQTRSVFEQIRTALSAAGMSMHDLVRTWFFLDGILTWYADFNDIRNAFFEEHGLFGRVLPASTAVGAVNSHGTALVADALAIQGTSVTGVASPLQCPATLYRSSFSRAVEVVFPARRALYISGTASIEPGGATAHVGNVDAQVALSMDVVREILRSRGMDWLQVVRAVAWVRNEEGPAAFSRWLREHSLDGLPVAIVAADICRDDLLFEIELDAVAPHA